MKRFAFILLMAYLPTPLAWSADDINELFRQADTANKAQKYDDALQIYQRCLAEFPDRVDAKGRIVNTLAAKAQAALTEHRYDDALHLYETILTEHLNQVDSCYSVQRAIVETLIKKGDLAEAARAVHLCMDVAPNMDEFSSITGLAANILSALDKNVDRANQLLAFEQSGPGGGAVNPMDAVGYPSAPEREHALEIVRQQAGDTVNASRVRAYTYLLTGKPKEALPHFADAFRRSPTLQETQRASVELTLIGLRDARGHGIGLEKVIQFVIFGPSGPDGKPNTPDDLADPFAQWLPTPPPPPGEGGLAGLSADDLDALRKVRTACQLYAPDPWVHENLRYHSFLVLPRVETALDNWGAPGQKDWYLDRAFESGAPDYLRSYVLAAARGRALHFGGIYPVLNEIDARLPGKDPKVANEMAKARTQFAAMCAELNRLHTKPPALNPLTRPASF